MWAMARELLMCASFDFDSNKVETANDAIESIQPPSLSLSNLTLIQLFPIIS